MKEGRVVVKMFKWDVGIFSGQMFTGWCHAYVVIYMYLSYLIIHLSNK